MCEKIKEVNKKFYKIDFDQKTYNSCELFFYKYINEKTCQSINFSSEIKKYKLSNDEAIHILAYVGDSAKWINSKLRKNIELTQDEKIFVKCLDSALSKMKKIPNKTVYRNHSFNDDFNEGQEIVFKEYLSTSLEDFFSENLLFVIKTLPKDSLSRDISKVSDKENEKEILFKRDSKFKIIKSKIKECESFPNRRIIYLDEIK